MTQEQFLKAECIMKKIRQYRDVLSGQSIVICNDYPMPVKILKIESHTDDYDCFKDFIESQIMKFEDELKKL